MEMAKVTSKGQITIPVSIRRRLGINEGDKLLFIDRPEGVMMVNPDMLPGGQAEASEKGAAAPTRRNVATDTGSKDKRPAEKQPSAQPPAQAAQAPPVPQALSAPPEKPGPQIQGLDLNTLLSEIRSIGSKI